MLSNELAHVVNALLKNYFRKKFIYVPAYEYSAEELKAAAALYNKWSGVMRAIPIVLFFVLPVIYGRCLYAVYIFYYSHYVSPPNMFFPQEWAAFIMPGIFLGIATMDQVAECLQRIMLNRKYDAFVDYSNRQEGFDNKKSFRLITRIFLVPFFITYLMVFTSALTVTPEKFTFKEAFGVTYRTYTYSQVKKITYFRSYTNKKKERQTYPHYKLFFVDKTSFRSDWYFEDVESSVPFIQVLQNKKILVDTAETEYGK